MFTSRSHDLLETFLKKDVAEQTFPLNAARVAPALYVQLCTRQG